MQFTAHLVLILLLSAGNLFANTTWNTGSVQNQPMENDTTYWSKEFSAGFNFNQSTFSGNWSGGGMNSLAAGSVLLARSDYERENISFDNQLELHYGLVRQGDRGTRKANDRIFLDSKIGYRLNGDWRSYFSANFTSQFTDGFDYENDERTLVSGFLSPAYITTSLGFEYKPSQEFNLRIGPLSPRVTIMRNHTIQENVPKNYGVPVGETTRTEWLAFQLFAVWERDFTEDLNIRSRYQMFANYETLNFENIDHRLDVTLTANITRLINVTLSSINIYDIDQDTKIQFSTGLALGILYKVGN
ncbi:MAG: DUF3078 domain-containing protein [Balneolales bacterium]